MTIVPCIGTAVSVAAEADAIPLATAARAAARKQYEADETICIAIQEFNNGYPQRSGEVLG
jgi:hypothetical protein